MGKNRLTLHWVTVLVILFFAFLAISSGSLPPPVVFDENMPPEESTTIYFVPGLEITSYNGIPVPTKKDILKILGMKSEWRNVTLPAGRMEFEFDAAWSSGSGNYRTDYTYRNGTFTYTFEPGEQYMLWFKPQDEGWVSSFSKWGIEITKQTPEKKWDRVDIVHLSGSDSGSGRIILE